MSGFPRSGLPITDGVIQMTAAPTALAATDVKKNGWAQKGDLSQMYKIDSPSAVPSTAIKHDGVAYSPDGGMYTTTAAPDATSTSKFGYVVRGDGAMHIDTVKSGTIEKGIRRNSNGVWITT